MAIFDSCAQAMGRGGAFAAPVSPVVEERLGMGTASRSMASFPMDRRSFLQGAVAGAATLAWRRRARAETRDLGPVLAQIEKRHNEAVQRLQEWIRQPSIAAENRGVAEACELTMRLLREAGFQQVAKVPTEGQPGIFATLDAGAPRTVGLYFMYDVKQVDPAEWSSPPWAAALVERPGLRKILVGRGAVNQTSAKPTIGPSAGWP